MFLILGVIFQANRNKRAHANYVSQSIHMSAEAMLRFYHSRRGQYILAATKYFEAKLLPHLLYGTHLESFPNLVSLEII